jgi:hypothetical protein
LFINVTLSVVFLGVKLDLTRYYKGDKIKEDEMCWACNTHGGAEKCVHNFGQKRPRPRGEDNF